LIMTLQNFPSGLTLCLKSRVFSKFPQPEGQGRASYRNARLSGSWGRHRYESPR
jgi:hypothetical protein